MDDVVLPSDACQVNRTIESRIHIDRRSLPLVSGLNDANVKRLKDVSVASLSARNEAQRCGCIVLQSDDVSVHTRRAILSMYYLQPIPGHKKECSRSSSFGVIYYEH
jgi:hypothetical protein